MNKTRIFGGFSLVEMMLLLLIVSLMIASSVAVISKRHVKVPRLAMHGAFMCYYKDNNGTKQLWEERYVGSGLNKKIVDQAAAGGDHCLFTPPDKVSYLHIQATGGGGGGGDSGYKGGDPQPHKSETEVLSPFGLTEEYLLEVKGITTAGDPAYGWGQIYAYADGRGVKGDAGGGGDLWYIFQDCANGGCLALRKWENKTSSPQEKACWNKTEDVSCRDGMSGDDCYRSETRSYWYNCWEDCGARNNQGKNYTESDCNSKCTTYEYTIDDAKENNPDLDECANGWQWGWCHDGDPASKCDYEDCDQEYVSCGGKTIPYKSCSSHCNEDEDWEEYTKYNCIGEEQTGNCSDCNANYNYTSKKWICYTNVTDWDWFPNGKYVSSCGYETGYCDGNYNGKYYIKSGGQKICDGLSYMKDTSHCGTGSKRWKPNGCHTTTDGAPSTYNAGVDADATCTDYYNIPNTAQECTISARKDINIYATDIYNDETNVGGEDDMYPSYRKVVDSPNDTYITERTTAPLIERNIARTEGTEAPVCTYGNQTLFANDGVFGSFVEDRDGVNVDCTTDALADAFGEGIIPITHGKTSYQSAFNQEIPSSQHYSPAIEYDVSEKYEGQNPYGKTEPATTVNTNTSAGNGTWTQSGSSSNMNYTNPFTDVTYKPYRNLPTACNLPKGYDDWQEHVTPKNESQCNSVKNTNAVAADGSSAYTPTKPLLIKFDSPTKKQEWMPVTSWSECLNVQSTWQTYDTAAQQAAIDPDTGKVLSGKDASICMLSFNDYDGDGKNQNTGATNQGGENLVDKNNGIYTVDKCSYYAEMVEGSEGGKGTFCTLGPIDGGYNLYYHGYSGILPGIRGSNAIAIADYNNADKIKALYTKAEWESQARVYAENGTDSAGYAEISLGVGGADQTCTLHPEGKNPTHGKGAYKPATGGSDAYDGTPDGRDGGYEGTNTNNAGIIGANQVGYIVSGKPNPENYKYKYWYTWDTNYMQYGEGGDAGEYIVKVVRAIKDRELKIFVGRGGAAGTQGSGEDGEDGGDTIIEGVLTAKGGFGGAGGLTTPVEQMPYYREGDEFDWIKGQAGTPGGRHDNLTIKSNIMNLILPVDNSFVLQQWVEASGEGGNGGGSKNTCWASGWIRNFEGRDDPQSFKDPDCRTGDEGTAEPAAEAGIDGLVLIRW